MNRYSKNPLVSWSLSLALAITSVAVGASTSTKRPAWMDQVNTGKPGQHAPLRPCKLDYELSWNGLVRAGSATMTLGTPDPENPALLLGECQGGSEGLAKKLWFYKQHFKSHVNASSLRPVAFESTETEKKAKVITTAAFLDNQVTATAVTKKGGKERTRERVFDYEKAYDLMSSVLYLRSLPLEKGQEITMVVHPFDRAYLAKFTVLDRETFKSDIGKTPAIKLDVKLHKILDNLELKAYDKFKQATIWISDDAFRMPLEIRSEVFIGSVRATLAKRAFLD